jgi:hypothetical protein
LETFMSFLSARTRSAFLFVTPIAFALSGCGSDDAASTPAATNVTGKVVKGPVGNSTVCVYSLSGGTRSTSTLVPCVTSDAAGAYTLAPISNYTGDLLIEATGGSYRNEATGATTTLSAPLRTVLLASGGTVTGMVTPLTTIAVAATGANTNSTTFAAAAGNVGAQAGLGSTNILNTAPSYGTNGTTATNAYAAALGALAQYQVTTGNTLTQTLANWANPSASNQAAFQTALNAYVAAAQVIAANLPANFNLSATGGPISYTVVDGQGTTVSGGTATGGSGLTVSGAATGFTPISGIGITVAGITSLTFTSLDLTIVSVTVDNSVNPSTSVVTLLKPNNQVWEYSCRGTACNGKVAVNATNKSVTLGTITLLPEAPATGNISMSGTLTYQ